MDYPQFKYHPNAYSLDIFVQEDGVCSICHKQRDLKYDCSFYSVDEPDYICPWCIVNGAAAEKYKGDFNDYCSIESVSPDPNDPPSSIDEKLLDEICSRTPSYVSWQQQVWLVHCNEPCKFIHYATSELLEPILPEVLEDIENSGMPLEWVQHHLTAESDFSGYLFQCVHCGKHRLHLDSC